MERIIDKIDFPKDWKPFSVNELGKVFKGKGVSKSEILDSGLPCIRYGEIYTQHHYKFDKTHSFINDESAKNSQEIKFGDVLFSGSGETAEEIGKAVCYCGNIEAYAGGDIVILRPKEPESGLFFGYLMNSDYVVQQKFQEGQGHSVVHIYGKSVERLKVVLPPLPEQQKIAAILSKWDALIDIQTKLIKAKEKQKTSLMQKFLTGEVRFPGFETQWQEVKLKEIGKIKMCKRIFNHETSAEGDIPFYKIGTFGKEADAFISQKKYDEYKSKFSYPKKGEILLSAAGTLGRTVVYDGVPAYFQDSNIVWLSHDELKVKNEFLLFVYKNIRFESEGGTIQRLYNSIIYNATFLLPPVQEQIKISSVLTACDTELGRLTEKLEAIKLQKKGLMQQLLTGKIRVKL